MNLWVGMRGVTGQEEPEWAIKGDELTAGDVVAMVAQQLEVMGIRPVLTDATKKRAEDAASVLLAVLVE